MSRTARRVRVAATAFAAVTVLAACSGSSDPTVSKDTLQSKVQTLMKQQTGKDYPVTCKGGLKGKADSRQRCTWKADDGSTLGITVTVNDVKDKKVNFHVQADDAATPAP